MTHHGNVTKINGAEVDRKFYTDAKNIMLADLHAQQNLFLTGVNQ